METEVLLNYQCILKYENEKKTRILKMTSLNILNACIKKYLFPLWFCNLQTNNLLAHTDLSVVYAHFIRNFPSQNRCLMTYMEYILNIS